jgi:hypothetical protein
VSYSNADSDKNSRSAIKENKGKSGVYCWTNLVNVKSYVGGGVDLTKRLSDYYSNQNMETQLKRGKSAIYSAILKYGRTTLKKKSFYTPLSPPHKRGGEKKGGKKINWRSLSIANLRT